mmetsp:Transcript_11261/g.23845  ORF Transcript_11261/g.23845 Transcript_11261/m.23845 type:complete len:106 (+) Transcript_11261:237-554(+)
MISHAKKILCLLLPIAALLSAEGRPTIITTKEKLLEYRAKRVVHLEHAMAQLKTQLDNHKTGKKPLDDQRVASLKKRMSSYKSQIYDHSKDLTPEEISELLEQEL